MGRRLNLFYEASLPALGGRVSEVPLLGPRAYVHDSLVAYQVDYYFDCRSQDSATVFASAVTWLRDAGLDVSVGEQSTGAEYGRDWMSGDLLVEGAYTGMSLEVHCGDDLTATAWREVLDVPGAPVLPPTPGLCILTFSGKTHDGAFHALRTFLTQQRMAAEYDETDGFTGA
jgi:hypothetical protein